MKTIKIILSAMVVAAAFTTLVQAQDQNYRPDIIEMDGSFILEFAPDAAYDVSDGGTIEFWTQPDWTQVPDFDPVILSNIGPDGVVYIIAMTAERDALVVVHDDDEDLFSFDFSDGKMHYVALNHYEDGFVIMVDGQIVGESDMILSAASSDGLWVGSLNGEINPYYGAIAALRFWDTVPDKVTLLRYARQDVFNPEHPDIGQLSAISDFENAELLILQEIE